MSVGRVGPIAEHGAVLRRSRLLPAAGEVLLDVGDRVEWNTTVARAPGRGRLHTINAARILDIPPGEVPGALVVTVGAAVEVGEVVARTRGLWGLFAAVCRAPVAGTVAAVSPHTGRILLEEPGAQIAVQAFLPGIVAAVVPDRGVTVAGWAARIAGVFGAGGERSGPLRQVVGRADAVLDAAQLDEGLTGAVIFGGSLVTAAALQRAAALGVVGLITGGVHDRDLTALLGQPSVLADTTAADPPLTIVVVGGFGRVPLWDDVFTLLRAHAGRRACVVGRTRVRAGAERPEVIIPLDGGPEQASAPVLAAPTLTPGCRVLVARGPWFGCTGRVGRLPAEPCRIESEARCPVADVDLDRGGTARVALANLELLGGPQAIGGGG